MLNQVTWETACAENGDTGKLKPNNSEAGDALQQSILLICFQK